ncbi:MAG: EamA family transporter, partial [Candidatus Latescibacteria bacterium]|nr:EamA family transporter [Candidatus Latescibacterota bacterium]
YLTFADQLAFSPAIFKVGASIGITFIASMLTMTYALTISGAAPVITAFRLSLLVPVALGIWIWDEPITATQLIGIACAVTALALMTRNKSSAHHLHRSKAFLIILAVFLIQGLGGTCLRWVHYADLDPYRLNVLMIVGATAGLLGFSLILLRRKPIHKKDMYVGISIGLYNAITLSVILTALSVVPGTLYFPVVGCSVVLLDNLFTHIFWKEHLSRPAIAGVAMAVLAIVLVM